MKITRDSQAVEILGKNLLINKLLSSGIEVAEPLRDRGVDLIAYIERRVGSAGFFANPIQVKVFQGAGFSIDKKYSKIANLFMVYVWNIADQRNVSFYAMTYEQAVRIARSMGYVKTRSWLENGKYVKTVSSEKLSQLMDKFKVV